MVLEIQITYGFLHHFIDLVCSDALNQGVVLECFFNCENREYRVILRAVAYQLASFAKIILNIEALNRDFTCCRCDLSC